jgi:hypothetical protein
MGQSRRQRQLHQSIAAFRLTPEDQDAAMVSSILKRHAFVRPDG